MSLTARDDRQMRALTGLTINQFDILLSDFERIHDLLQQEAYEKQKELGNRKRILGGGRKGRLHKMEDKLMFVLYYFKTYPTFDVLGTHFNLARSKAHENLYKLIPVLYRTLVELEMMPAREYRTVNEMKDALSGIDKIIIDATERQMRRSIDDETQREHYSGKKTTYNQKYYHYNE